MKKICFVILISSLYFSAYSQNKDYSKFTPEKDDSELLINTIYKRGAVYFIKTKKGEVQPALLRKIRLHDTSYLRVKNFSYMVNLKYHSRNLLNLEVLLFFDKKDNTILVKQISKSKITSYKFNYLLTENLMVQ